MVKPNIHWPCGVNFSEAKTGQTPAVHVCARARDHGGTPAGSRSSGAEAPPHESGGIVVHICACGKRWQVKGATA